MTDSTLETGTPVTLTCHTTSQGHVTYKFFLNGKEIRHSDRGTSYVVTHGGGNSSYTCTATINGVQSTASSPLSIKAVGKCSYRLFTFLKYKL